jgi:class 3 adenylate cyclase/predicted metal-dependent HD superfamily phosphohydrolase
MDAQELQQNEIKLLKERVLALEALNRELVVQNNELIQTLNDQAEQLSILPKTMHKHREDSRSLRYQMVTVLYADIKGFTSLVESKNAGELIDQLDHFFIRFDEVVKQNNIERIKSVGDSYIAAGGIPQKNRTNPIEVILAALQMFNYLRDLRIRFHESRDEIWDLTIGIHTGPVVATIMGSRKVTYDIKGDTVNIASRIESASVPGTIFISEMTYELVKDYFVCEYRGKIPVKIQGEIDMYSIKGFRPELSIDGLGLMPNIKFRTKFQLIGYDDLEQTILDRLERELPKHLYYHNLKHTIDVINGVEVIGTNEGVNDEEMLLLKTAALFHDLGQIYGSVGHEAKGCEMADEYLEKAGYTLEQVSEIKSIIMATKLPPEPKNLLQQIICDADLDYLGRKDFVPVSDTLFRELKVQNLIGSLNNWNQLQVKFLSNHQFFTDTAKKLRQVNKEKQIERIRDMISD